MKFICKITILFIVLFASTDSLTVSANTQSNFFPVISSIETEGISNAAAFSKDGNYLALGDHKGFVYITDSNGVQVAKWKASEETIRDIFYSPDGEELFIHSDNAVSVWKTSTLKLDRKIRYTDGTTLSRPLSNLTFSNDYKTLFVNVLEKVLAIDVKSGQVIREYPVSQHITSIAYNDLKDELILSFYSGDFVVYNATTGGYKSAFQKANGIYNLAFTKDFKILMGTNDSMQPFFFKTEENYSDLLLELDEFYFHKWNGYLLTADDKFLITKNSQEIAVFDRYNGAVSGKISIWNASPAFAVNPQTTRLLHGGNLYDISSLLSGELTAINMKTENPEFKPGEIQELKVIGKYANGTQKEIDLSETTITSSNPEIVKIAYGKLVAGKTGIAKITAEYRGVKSTISLEVMNFSEAKHEWQIPSDKVWTVSFNKSLNPNTLHEQNLFIEDENRKVVPVTYKVLETNSKKVQLIPIQPYKARKTYTLWVKDVESANGKHINKYVKKKFTVK